MKHNNICIMEIPEGEESEKGIKNLFEEIMTENFPNLGKENGTQVQKVQRVLKKLDPERYILRHIIIKMTRLEKKRKSHKRKAVSYIQGGTN